MKTNWYSTDYFAIAASLLLAIALPRALAASAPVAPPPSNSTPVAKEEPVQLPPFTVSTESPSKYSALDAISSSRMRTDLLQTATSISVITNAMIQEIAPQRLFDALRYLPGVADGNSPNVGDRVTLRGFTALNSGYLDGVPFPTNLQLDPIIVERQELLGGPNAVIAPNGLPGGTINTVTKAPSSKPGGFFSVTVGHYNANRMDFDLTGPLGKKSGLFYRLVANFQDTNKVANDTKLKQTILFPSLTYKLNNLSITYKYLYDYQKANYEGSLAFDPSASPTNNGKLLNGLNFYAYLSPPNLYRTAKLRIHNMLVQTDITSHITARLYAQYTDAHSSGDSETIAASTPLGGAVNPLTGIFTPGVAYGPGPTYTATTAAQPNWTSVPFSGSYGPGRSFSTTLQNDYVAVYELPYKTTSTTTVGWGTTESKSRNLSLPISVTGINIYNPIWPTQSAAVASNSGSDSRSSNIYVLEGVKMLGDRLFLHGGVQATATRGRSDNFITHKFSFSRGNAPTKHGSALYMITPHMSLYADYSENSSPISSGLPLAPVVRQYGKQKEVGLKVESPNRRFRFTAACYDIRQTNFGVANLAAVADPTLPSTLLLDVKSRGTEFSGAGQINRNINLIATYSYNRIRDPFGRRLRSVPDNVASALISYSWVDGLLKNLDVNVGASYQSTRAGDTQTGITAAAVPIQPTFYVEPLTILRAGASYKYNRYFIRMSATNLANKKYLIASTRYTSYAGMPFNLTTEVGVRF